MSGRQSPLSGSMKGHAVPEGITRRQALKLVGGTAAVGVMGSGTAVAQNEGNGRDEALENIPLIDVHTHLVPVRAFGRAPFRADTAVKWMDEHGVDQIVLLPLESPTSWSFPIPSWWMLREAAKYPDRFIPFGSVPPLLIEQFGRETLERRIETYVEEGAQGIGELKTPMPVNDQRAQVVYEKCGTLDIPVLIHMDDVNLSDNIGLPKLEEMLKAFSDTNFIAHGPGWWSQISRDPKQFGGYPQGPVKPGGPIPQLLSEYDNMYADISAGSGWNALTRDLEFTQSFLNRFHEQIIFGTDKLSASQFVDQFNLFELFHLSRKKWENIRYENIVRLLADVPFPQ